MDLKQLSGHLLLILLSTALHACVVVPKKVASYDQTCKVAVQKISLDIEQMKSDTSWHCTNDDCVWDISEDIAEAVFTTATSAVVSGSIALAGNTAYWLEREGKCPNEDSDTHQQRHQQSPEPQQTIDDKYLIEEQIITTKS